MPCHLFFTGNNAQSFDNSVSLLSFSTLTKLASNTRFVRMKQVHGNNIAKITQKSLKNFHSVPNNAFEQIVIPNVDAVFTSEKNIYLTVKTADCLPVLIYGETITDNKKSILFVAAAHAGRKSTNAKIIYKLLNQLATVFISAENKNAFVLHIWFGPAICKQCYQIDAITDLHYDLIKKNKEQILSFLSENHIDSAQHLKLEVDGGCTLHEPEKYYSYRKTGKGVKMNYSFIGILE